MAYNKNLPAGTYKARALQADTFPTRNNEGLMLGVEWVITDGQYEGSQISGNICLVDNQGNLTKNYESVREWAKSWDGIKTEYFKGHFGEWVVEIVIERVDREIDGVMQNVPEVKWVNDPNGSHGKKITNGDHKMLGSKFGAKLRAAASAYNKAHPEAATKAAAKPVQSAGAEPSNATTPAQPDGENKCDVAWAKFTAQIAKENLPTAERNQRWFNLVARFTDSKDYRNLPDEVWDKVIDDLDNDIPF